MFSYVFVCLVFRMRCIETSKIYSVSKGKILNVGHYFIKKEKQNCYDKKIVKQVGIVLQYYLSSY